MTETRNLIRMCRLEDYTTEEMARRLDRTPNAIRYRLAKLFVEHMDGRETTDENIRDVSNWLVNVGE
jgi:DNA-directed RNA polymerase specialized sigma24 family protein